MNLPPGLSKEGAAEKKRGQIPSGKKTSKITNVLIDTHEVKRDSDGKPLSFHWDRNNPNLTFIDTDTSSLVMALPAGDVMCSCDDGNTILIERKTPSDFLHTLSQGRLDSQCERMTKVTPWCYIIVTGIFYRLHTGFVKVGGRETRWNYDAIEGAKLSCQELGVGVVHCAQGDFEGAVKRLCKRDRSVKRVQPARETALLTEGEQCIAALPGIGHERVQALIKELGSPVRALEWLTDPDDATKVPGVADGTKRKVIKALGLGKEKLAMVARGALPFYLPDEQGSFVATTPGAYGWMCDLWKERENENQKRNS